MFFVFFLTKGLHFHFALGPTNDVTCCEISPLNLTAILHYCTKIASSRELDWGLGAEGWRLGPGGWPCSALGSKGGRRGFKLSNDGKCKFKRSWDRHVQSGLEDVDLLVLLDLCIKLGWS